jgi:hypothetical protein
MSDVRLWARRARPWRTKLLDRSSGKQLQRAESRSRRVKLQFNFNHELAVCLPYNLEIAMSPKSAEPRLELPAALGAFIIAAAMEIATKSQGAFRVEQRRIGRGTTLRPGKETSLWNEFRSQLKPYLRKYGDQVNLGRVVGCRASASMRSSQAEGRCRLRSELCSCSRG